MRDASQDGRRDDFKNFRIGYGWDNLARNGRRVALQVGPAGGESPDPYGTLIIQWGPQR
jgi:hypothetical protein